MKSRKLLFTLVFVLAFVLVLAISACAATITLYSGADDTTPYTTHASPLTLTGNTEENETVTVYFTDDGRAWKAGETVSFGQDTTLYTIECTKILSSAQWNASTGGNYILVKHLDFNFSEAKPDGSGGQGSGTRDNAGGPMDLVTGSTTRVFFNGYTIGSGNASLFTGTDVSIYLLGNGKINGYWGGRFINLRCTSTSNSKIVIGKGITANGDWTNKCPFISLNNFKAGSKLDIHFYGTYTLGQLVSQNETPSTGSYNIYFHDGCNLNLTSVQDGGRLISTATTPIANIIIDGGNIFFGRDNIFVAGADLSRVTFDITAGSFKFDYASALAPFVAGINSESKAVYTNDTTFKVVCKSCDFEKTLGDDFVDLTTEFTINNYCPKCKTVGEKTTVGKIFEPLGYATNSTGTAINAGFKVNYSNLELYEEVAGEISYGIVIANADTLGGKTFFNSENKVNTDKSVQIDLDKKYSFFSCSLEFGTNSNGTLRLVIATYVITDGGVTFIQHTTGDTVENGKIAGGIFKCVTLDLINSRDPEKIKEELE